MTELVPLSGGVRELFSALADLREPVVMATVVGVAGSAPRHGAARMLVYADGRILGTVGGGQLERRVIETALEVLTSRRAVRLQVHLTRDLGMCCGGAMDVYIEPIFPPEHLVIFGAGHVGGEVARIAQTLDLRLTVVDTRDEWLSAARFPTATHHLGDPRAFARTLHVTPSTYLLITTHDHALDQDLLEILVDRPWAWLGVIGSRAKITKFFLRLRAAGVDETLFARVSAPVGLDLGAETPAEIAVSIAAEIIAVRRGKTGATLAMSRDSAPGARTATRTPV